MPSTAAINDPCPRCHGSGQVLISLCCGRGCATCPGEGMMQNVDCFGCHGTGQVPPPVTGQALS